MKKGILVGAVVLLVSGACASRRGPRAPGAPPPSVQEGYASWYGLEEAGRSTASGEPMAPEKRTAAHRTLAFGSLVRVTDLDTGRQVDVTINDRGPFVDNRIIDLSFAAARDLGMVDKGVARVRIEVIGLHGPLAERRWRVQIGSFTSLAGATDLQTQVQAEGFAPVIVSEFEDGGVLYFRVWVGELRERNDAERLAQRLRRSGHQGFVLLAAAGTR